jgi:hypothetical protein
VNTTKSAYIWDSAPGAEDYLTTNFIAQNSVGAANIAFFFRRNRCGLDAQSMSIERRCCLIDDFVFCFAAILKRKIEWLEL